MLQALKESVEYLKEKIGVFEPEIGIVLGTGLGGLVKDIEVEHSIMYSSIPNFPISTLEFHSGKLIFGTLKGKKVVPCRADCIITKVIRCNKLLRQ